MEKYIRLELESSVFTTKNGEESRIELKQAGAKKQKVGGVEIGVHKQHGL